MTPAEEDYLKYSDARIKGIVIDQWKLFTHFRVRKETQKNFALSKMFTLLANKRHQVKHDALHRVTKYAIFVKQKFKRRKSLQQKITSEQRYERLAVGLDTWIRVLRSQKK